MTKKTDGFVDDSLCNEEWPYDDGYGVYCTKDKGHDGEHWASCPLCGNDDIEWSDDD